MSNTTLFNDAAVASFPSGDGLYDFYTNNMKVKKRGEILSPYSFKSIFVETNYVRELGFKIIENRQRYQIRNINSSPWS